MISICIPIYNYDCRKLLRDLSTQAELLNIPYEILAIDDASDSSFRSFHRDLQLPYYRYIGLHENIGRSKIRNRLVVESKYPYMICMDCDVEMTTANFLSDYLPFCRPEAACCGGHVYSDIRPVKSLLFHWKYGKMREGLPAAKRRTRSDQAFHTSNFLIDKSLLQRLRFDESLVGYGYEDVLMGLALSAKGINILHVDNPVVHVGLEDTAVFLTKARNALRNLKYIESAFDEKGMSSAQLSGIIRMKKKLQRLHLLKFVGGLYSIGNGLLERNLKGKYPIVFLFDLYRLGYYCSL